MDVAQQERKTRMVQDAQAALEKRLAQRPAGEKMTVGGVFLPGVGQVSKPAALRRLWKAALQASQSSPRHWRDDGIWDEGEGLQQSAPCQIPAALL